MFRTRTLATCLLLAGLLVLGCSDDDEDDPGGPGEGKPPTTMVDTWVFQSVTLNGAAANLADVLEWQPATVSAEIYIEANGTYVFQEVNAAGGQLWFESGFVFVEGGEIDINVLQDQDGPVNETSFLTYTLAGDTLTLTEVDAGTTVVFTLGRKP